MANWALRTKSITITLGCSKNPTGSTCTDTNTGPDPKCPTVWGPKEYCTAGTFANCIKTWGEQCSSGTSLQCTEDLVLTWCVCS